MVVTWCSICSARDACRRSTPATTPQRFVSPSTSCMRRVGSYPCPEARLPSIQVSISHLEQAHVWQTPESTSCHWSSLTIGGSTLHGLLTFSGTRFVVSWLRSVMSLNARDGFVVSFAPHSIEACVPFRCLLKIWFCIRETLVACNWDEQVLLHKGARPPATHPPMVLLNLELAMFLYSRYSVPRSEAGQRVTGLWRTHQTDRLWNVQGWCLTS